MVTRNRAALPVLLVAICLFAAEVGIAAPAHVVRFYAAGPPLGCRTVGWHDLLTFYNASTQSLTVKVLGISNGRASRVNPDTIEVPPGAVVWADDALRDAWIPEDGARLWV